VAAIKNSGFELLRHTPDLARDYAFLFPLTYNVCALVS